VRAARALLACALLWALAGCAPPTSPSRPVALTYRPEADGLEPPPQVRSVVERVSGAHVRVVIYGPTEDEGMPALWIVNGGSGTIVDPCGLVITAAHVARSARFLARVIAMDGRTHEAEILGVIPESDLAVMKIAPFAGMQVARLAAAPRLAAGRRVFAIGAPGNRMGVVALGRVVRARRERPIDYGEFGFEDAIELEMEVEPGFSGGPLFDDGGRLVGMLAGFGLGDTRRAPYVPTRVAFAVPAHGIARHLASCRPRERGQPQGRPG